VTQLKISEKGWVVIPADLRRKYGLTPGTQVQVIDYGGVVSLVPLLKNPIRDAAGMLKSQSLTRAVLAEHAEELSRESPAA
jgi:AbrB family looped-hinge helix DNA binding protein